MRLGLREIACFCALSACAAPNAADVTGDILPRDATRPSAFDIDAKGYASTKWAALATVSCRIEADGRPSNCVLRDLKGNAAFGAPSLEYARSIVYQPGFSTGAGPVIPDRIKQIGFLQATRFFRASVNATVTMIPTKRYPAEVTDRGSAIVQLACDIAVDGSPTQCNVLKNTGEDAFGREALLETKAVHYMPAWRDGHAVNEPHHIIRLVFSPPDVFADMPAETPGIVFGKPQSPTRLEYPATAMEKEREGSALVLCDLGVDGVNRNCRIGGVHGDAAFGQAALHFESGVVEQATRGGIPVAVPNHASVLRFVLSKDQW